MNSYEHVFKIKDIANRYTMYIIHLCLFLRCFLVEVFSGDDGWNFPNETQGELEFYAWSETLLTPTKTGSTMLGQSVPGPNLQQNRDTTFNVDSTFTRVWVYIIFYLSYGT